MPELPDVQVFKEYVDATSLHRPVRKVYVQDGRELHDVTAETVRSRLRGSELASTRRHGKHLFLELEGGTRWLRLHFGMTGSLRAWDGEAPDDLDPEHVRLRLDFEDGRHLAYRCPRRFGEIGLVDDPDSVVQERSLGPDPLEGDFDVNAFRGRLDGRRGRVKTTLMNQEVLAGLGNIYVDEILFQTGLHPETGVPELDDDAVTRLYRVMGRVLRKAIEVRVDPDRMPRSWLLPRREEGRACPRCDGTIRRIEVSGRSTYLCSRHQRASGSG